MRSIAMHPSPRRAYLHKQIMRSQQQGVQQANHKRKHEHSSLIADVTNPWKLTTAAARSTSTQATYLGFF
jgi:hypothetical protein